MRAVDLPFHVFFSMKLMPWSSPIYIRWHELTSFGAQWLLLLGWQSWPALFWAPVPRPHIYKLWSNFGGKEKVLEMSPGHLVKSSLGDIVGQDPLIAFSKRAFVVLRERLPKSVNWYLSHIPREWANSVDTRNINNISFSFLQVRHSKHCQV